MKFGNLMHKSFTDVDLDISSNSFCVGNCSKNSRIQGHDPCQKWLHISKLFETFAIVADGVSRNGIKSFVQK